MDKTDLNNRLLIIDDNQAIHDDLKKILCPAPPTSGAMAAVEEELFGDTAAAPLHKPFNVDSAFQGQDGLAAVVKAHTEGRPYSVAFIDVRMPPGWDGIQTTREIWKIDPDIQVVVCTAYSDYSWSDMIAELGQSDRLVVLKKPFDNIEALQLVHALTRKWDLSRQARCRVEELDRLVSERTEQLRAANEKLLADIQERRLAEIRLAAFTSLGTRLSAAQDARTAALIIVEVADQLLGWDCCFCDMYSEVDGLIHPVFTADTIDGCKTECESTAPSHKPSPLAAKVIREGGQLILRTGPGQLSSNANPFGDKNRPSASLVYVPIRNGNSVVGLLSVQSYKPNAYDERSLATLQALADHCAGALNRIKSEETLHRTEQQLRQAQKMEAVGQLAGGVAHDFNNILAVIIGNAELAQECDPPLPPMAQDCQKHIVDAANRAANLTRQLLAFGRKQIFHSQALNLNQQLKQMGNMLGRIIGEDIQLRCAYAQDLPLVQADASMIDQVIMNLAVNARDAMPKGGRLQIETELVELDACAAAAHPDGRTGRFACIKVADTGVGISKENLARIFEPFFTTKDVGKGTGLGLATVFGIVKQHKGWVEVSSEAGAGATFRVFLPALGEAAPVAASVQPKADVRGGSESILLVEDDPAVRQVNRRTLEAAGYRLLEASSGQEALGVWANHREEIKLVLTDIVMPGDMNGRSLAQRLVTAKPGLKVVFMSGYSGNVFGDSKDAAATPGVLLSKPFTRDRLLSVVREQLDGAGHAAQSNN